MAIIFTPGQVVAAPDWDALFQQHRGAKSQQIRVPTKDERRAIEDAGDDVDQNPIYRYYAEDGSYVEARTAPNGDYQIVDYKPSAAFTQAQTKAAASAQRTPEEQRTQAATATATEATAAEKQAEANERAWHIEQGHGSYTHKEWAAEEARRAPASDTKPLEGYPGWSVRTTKVGPDTRTEFINPQGQPGTDPRPATGAPKAGPAYQNAQGKWVQPITDAQGNVTGTQPVPAGAEPKQPSKPPTNISAPPTQEWVQERHEDGTVTVTKNPNWKPQSKIERDPETGKYVEITQNADGNGWTIKPVTDQTTIKPADLPVLQAKYGEISQGLGALAADLNGRFARGEITEKQRNDAFAAGHQQASTQITEINSILQNSRSAWQAEIEQRGQTLSDTAGRRTFAGNVLGQAVSTGQALAISSGPGHGAAIAGGVGALLNIGQRYAEGMGGFRESPEIAMPAAVRQAREVGLPGFAMPSAMPAAGGTSGGTSGGPLAAPAGPVSAGTGVTQTTDAGGPGAQPVPRVMTPASSAPAADGRQAFAPQGVNPLVAQMAQQLQGGSGFMGTPAAAGGAGVFDPLAEGERMLSTRAGDTDWEEAVRRAAQAVGQPRQPGYQRFSA